MLPLCEREQVAYLVFSPLAGGWLTGKYRRGEPFPAGSRMTQRPEPYAPFQSDGHVRPARAAGGRCAARTTARWRGWPWRGCWPTRA